MRIDVYTKTILTLIALLLGAVAFRPIVQPTPALAQANLSAFQITGGGVTCGRSKRTLERYGSIVLTLAGTCKVSRKARRSGQTAPINRQGNHIPRV